MGKTELNTFDRLGAATLVEEVGEQRSALGFQHARMHLNLMIQTRLAHDIEDGSTRTSFLVPGAEHQPGDPGQHDRPGAHGTRLQRDDQGAIIQTPTVLLVGVPLCPMVSRATQCQHLGMGGGIAVLFSLIGAGADDVSGGVDDHRADGHIPAVTGVLSQFDRLMHPAAQGGVVRDRQQAHDWKYRTPRTWATCRRLVAMQVHVVEHPLIAHKLTELRRQETPSNIFRQLTEELVMLLAYEATRNLELEDVEIQTPVTKTVGKRVMRPRPLVVPILRAGLGMLEGMVRMAPTAEVGFLGMARNEETLDIVTYAERLPADLTGRHVFVLDPMLATGGTLAESINFLYQRNARRVTCICLLGAPEGLARLEESHGDVDVDLYLASIDEKLTDKAYIYPGLGDAGDRLYGVAE